MENLTSAKSGIYIITNLINNKYYIGSTSDFKSGCRSHRTLLKNNLHFNSHLQAAWNKYGEENFSFDCLEEVLLSNFQTNEEFIEVLNKREEFYITSMNATDNKCGYNARKECNTNLGLKWPEESRKRFSESKKGKPLSPRALAAARENAKKRIGIPNPSLKKWAASLTDDEYKQFRQRVSDKRKESMQKRKLETGNSFTEDAIKRIREKRGINPVYCYKFTGEFVKEFPTVAHAIEGLGISTRNYAIKECIDVRAYKDYFWSYTKFEKLPYVERLRMLKETNRCTQPRKIAQYDLNHNLIKIWDSVTDASKSIGYVRSAPFNDFISKNLPLRNYYWKYIDAYAIDCIGKPEELLETPEMDDQQPSQEITSLEGSETNS